MVIVLAIAAVLVVLGLVFTWLRIRRTGGGLALKITGRLLNNRLGRAVSARAAKRLLASGSSMEQMQKMMTANPELIERLAKEQGLDPAQARAAATRFTSLDESAQRDLIARASAGLESGASATQIAASIGRTPARRNANSERAAAKRKAAARARRQNTKKRSR